MPKLIQVGVGNEGLNSTQSHKVDLFGESNTFSSESKVSTFCGAVVLNRSVRLVIWNIDNMVGHKNSSIQIQIQ